MNKRGFLKTLGAFVGLSMTGIPFAFSKPPLQKVHCLSLIEQIRRGMEKSMCSYIFEQNDEKTRLAMTQTVTEVLEHYKNRNAIYKFSVASYPRLDKNTLDVQVMIQPIRSIEYVVINATILPIS